MTDSPSKLTSTGILLLLLLSLIALPAPLQAQSDPPADLGITALSTDSVTLAWTDSSGGAEGVVIARSPDGGTWTEAVALDPGVSTWTDSGLPCSTVTHYRVGYASGDQPAQAAAATLPCEADGGPQSDDFSDPEVSSSRWHFFDPYTVRGMAADVRGAVDFSGSNADLFAPGGITHDLWQGSNFAPRLLQSVPDGDFAVEVDFDTLPTMRYQLQGIIVAENNDSFIRLGVFHDGLELSISAAYVGPGSAESLGEGVVMKRVPADTIRLRVQRAGDDWVYSYSFDGERWLTASAFTHPLAVAEIGIYAGNHDPAPPHIASVDAFLNLNDPLEDTDARVLPTTDTPTPPEFTIWYTDEADTLTFGQVGTPQRWLNVIGHLDDPDGLHSLTYRIDGGDPIDAPFGLNISRLIAYGDFNIEIDRHEIGAGTHTITLEATDRFGATASRTITLVYDDSAAWPLPYTIDWSTLDAVTDGAQVVDGLWEVTPNGVHTVTYGYDRLLNIGDENWPTNYEVLLPFTVHQVLSRSETGVGFGIGWQGHAGDDRPRVAWPLEAIVWLANYPAEPTLQVLTYPGRVEAAAPFEAFALNTRFLLRAQSVALDAETSRVSARLWVDGTPEPGDWQVVADVPDHAGSVLLLAHLSEVTFGPVEVNPVAADALPVLPGAGDPGAPELSAARVYPASVVLNWSGSPADAPLAVERSTDGDTWGEVAVLDPGAGAYGVEGVECGVGAQYRLRVDSPAGEVQISAPMEVAAFPCADPAAPLSDDFDGDTLSDFWRYDDPYTFQGETAGLPTLAFSDGQAHIALPEGYAHDLWAGDSNRAPRLLQPVPDGDLALEARFTSVPALQYQLQGIIVQGQDVLLRLGTYHDGTHLYLFVARITASEGQVIFNQQLDDFPGAITLRLERAGDDWTLSYSPDGEQWPVSLPFGQPLTVTEVGVYGGNFDPAPAFIASVDYFHNLAAAQE